MDVYIAVCCGLVSIFVVIFILKKFGLCLEIENFLATCSLIFYPGFANIYPTYKLSGEGCWLVVLFTLATMVSVFCAHYFYDKMPNKLTLQTNNLTINQNKFFWAIIGLFYFYAIVVFLSYRHYQSDYIPFLYNHRFITENIPGVWYRLFIHPYIVAICSNLVLLIMFFGELNKSNTQNFLLLEKHNFLLFVAWIILFGLGETNPKFTLGYLGITWILFLFSISKKTLAFYRISKYVIFCIFFVILSAYLKTKQIHTRNYSWEQHLQRIYNYNINTVPFLSENFYHKYNKEISCSFWDYLNIRLKNDKTKKSATNVMNGFALLTSDGFSQEYHTGFQYSLQAFLYLNYGLYSIFYWFFISFLITLASRFLGKLSGLLFIGSFSRLLTPLNVLVLSVETASFICIYFLLKRCKILVPMRSTK